MASEWTISKSHGEYSVDGPDTEFVEVVPKKERDEWKSLALLNTEQVERQFAKTCKSLIDQAEARTEEVLDRIEFAITVAYHDAENDYKETGGDAHADGRAHGYSGALSYISEARSQLKE
jgi:hypothetical protein